MGFVTDFVGLLSLPAGMMPLNSFFPAYCLCLSCFPDRFFLPSDHGLDHIVIIQSTNQIHMSVQRFKITALTKMWLPDKHVFVEV